MSQTNVRTVFPDGMEKRRLSQRRTGVVKKGVYNGAVFERGSHWGDIFKVAVEERRIDERDRLELHTDEPGETWETSANSFLSCKLE